MRKLRYNFKVLFILSFLFFAFSGCCEKQTSNNNLLPGGNSTNLYDFENQAKTYRASSADPEWQNGNADSRRVDPGETLVLADIKVPGQINHIWSTIAVFHRYYPRHLILRIYWDGSKEPAVEAPIGDFFAVGHGMLKDVNSEMVANSSYGRSYNCYWKMPFRKNARVTVTNDSDKPITGFFWYIDYQKMDIAEGTPYFYARYRQENPVDPDNDYLIFDGEGKGFYVGTVMSVRMSMPGWFGEGDDRFYIDGSDEPVLKGTGTEDYFCDAWGFRELNRPYYGISVWEGMVTGGRCTAYRWHIYAPIYFDKSLKFTIEHKGNTYDPNDQMISGYTSKRPDFYSSVAFWYQTGEPKQFGAIPPVEKRLPEYTVLEAEKIIDVSKNPELTIEPSIAYSGGSCVQFAIKEVGGTMEFTFDIEEEGKYAVFLGIIRFVWGGIYDIYLDDRLIRSFDSYCEHSPTIDLKLGHVQNLKKGKHVLKLVCTGSNDLSFAGNKKGYYLRLDYLAFEKVGINWGN